MNAYEDTRLSRMDVEFHCSAEYPQACEFYNTFSAQKYGDRYRLSPENREMLVKRTVELVSFVCMWTQYHIRPSALTCSRPLDFGRSSRPYINATQLEFFLRALGFTERDRHGEITGVRGTLFNPSCLVDFGRSGDACSGQGVLDRIVAISTMLHSLVMRYKKGDAGMRPYHFSDEICGRIEQLLIRAGYTERNDDMPVLHIPHTFPRCDTVLDIEVFYPVRTDICAETSFV